MAHDDQHDDIQRLQYIDGIGQTTAERLINHFGSLYGVVSSAYSHTDELVKVRGISKEYSQQLAEKMRDAGITRKSVISAEQVRRMNETSGGWGTATTDRGEQ